MGLKDIFTIQDIEPQQRFQQDDTDDSIAVISGASYASKGTRDAGYCEVLLRHYCPDCMRYICN